MITSCNIEFSRICGKEESPPWIYLRAIDESGPARLLTTDDGMYCFLDQSPDRLTGGSHFILWAMRGWVMAVMKEKCPAASLMQPFTRMGMRTVLPDFHQLMFTVNHRGQRRMTFGDRGHGMITEIEAIFLALWVDMAEGQEDRARKVLHLLIVEEKVEDVFAWLKHIVCHMETINFAPNRVLQSLPAS